jgi:hypothetical protein
MNRLKADSKYSEVSEFWDFLNRSLQRNSVNRSIAKQNTPRAKSDIASKTLPNLINPFIQCAESGMNASVVKAEQIGK